MHSVIARWSLTLTLANWALTNPPWKKVNFKNSAVDDEASGSEWLSAAALIARHSPVVTTRAGHSQDIVRHRSDNSPG